MTLAEQIRPLLTARDPAGVGGAGELVASFLAQCRAINDRLARCADYLRRGLRCEAVHLAQCHPNVLREAQDLQSIEAGELERLCNSLGLVRPEAPNDAVLEDLAGACEIEESLAPLLSQHRTLAVGRGPIRQRLGVLYALAKSDAENQIWQSDIRQMELERAKGIDREYKTAIRESDLSALEELWHEVAQTSWLKPPPRELVSRIQKSTQKVRREGRIKALRKVITGLQTARDAGEFATCGKLLDDWQSLTKSNEAVELELPADLLNEGMECVQSTGTWLTTERRHRLEGQRNGQRRPGAPRRSAGGRRRSWPMRALIALMSPLRFLAPRKSQSAAEAEPAPASGA